MPLFFVLGTFAAECIVIIYSDARCGNVLMMMYNITNNFFFNKNIHVKMDAIHRILY
jgi:hypothetical protein